MVTVLRYILLVLLSFGCLSAASFSLKTGEVLQGEILAADQEVVVFQSEGLGRLTLSRDLLSETALAQLENARPLPVPESTADPSEKADAPAPKLMPTTEAPAKVIATADEDATDRVPYLNRLTGLPGELSLTLEGALTQVRNGNEINTFLTEFTLDWKLDEHELSTFHRFVLGEVNDATVQEQRAHSLRYAWQFADRWIWLNQYDWFLDTTSLVDAKSQFISAPGYYLLKNEKWTFLFGAGLGHLSLDYDTSPFPPADLGDFDARPSDLAGFAYQYQRINFTKALVFTQSFLVGTMLDEDLTTAELRFNLAHALTDNLSIVLEGESIYISEPLPNVPDWIENLQLMLQFKL